MSCDLPESKVVDAARAVLAASEFSDLFDYELIELESALADYDWNCSLSGRVSVNGTTLCTTG